MSAARPVLAYWLLYFQLQNNLKESKTLHKVFQSSYFIRGLLFLNFLFHQLLNWKHETFKEFLFIVTDLLISVSEKETKKKFCLWYISYDIGHEKIPFVKKNAPNNSAIMFMFYKHFIFLLQTKRMWSWWEERLGIPYLKNSGPSLKELTSFLAIPWREWEKTLCGCKNVKIQQKIDF